MHPTRANPFRSLCVLATVALYAGMAQAANPRWTTGAPFFSVGGSNIIWYTDSPLYSTDPGDLSSFVNHAAADAMVAAAAQVWNVPTSRMTLAQGGVLAEQVSGSNVYMGSNGLVFPNDVESTNYAAVQIPVIYDRDGSVTDLLLGGGASDPSGCLQHAVTESVDSIVPAGYIQHAILILNGRCTGAAPEMQLQMQYQLERAFGRVLGVGWSQLNDNVFTGTTQSTYEQAQHWPIMHPIDIICGPFTYQCLPDPFTLRDDDVAAISILYTVDSNSVPPGKQATYARAGFLHGNLRFPNQEGMGGVNVVLSRNNLPWQVLDDYEDVSAVSGHAAEQFHGSPVEPKPAGIAGSFGEIFPYYDVAGYYKLGYIPIPADDIALDILVHTEPVNPLYTGEYAINSYPLSTVVGSGDTVSFRFNNITPFWNLYWEPPMHNVASGIASIGGTESSPASIPPSGWWTDVLCGPNQSWSFDHTPWFSLPVRANHTFAIEMTALDEGGTATGNKLRPVLGLWRASDATGTPPSVNAAPVAFNGVTRGMTALFGQTTAADTFRFALASETGDGRPDYNYQARVLYADTATPSNATAGTHITLTGVGFRTGNTVKVNGVTASVISWSNTSIVAVVPFLPGVLPGTSVPANILVTDLSTGSTTTMTAAFQYVYTAPTYILQLVSGPSANQIVSLPATPAFAVKVLNSDGITPLAGASVLFSATAGTVVWTACGTPVCTVLTDSTGLASTGLTPQTAGAVTLQATAQAQTLQSSFVAAPLSRSASITPATRFLAAGATASWTATASFQQQGAPAQTAVTWTSASPAITLSNTNTATGSNGTASATVHAGPLAAGAQGTGTACAWTNVCATFTATGVDPAQISIFVTGGGTQNLSGAATFTPITLQIVDGLGNPVGGAGVTIFQTVRPWTPPCPVHGRCPLSPSRQTVQTSAISDIDGNLSITPLDPGGPEVTGIVLTVGTEGYAALIVQRSP